MHIEASGGLELKQHGQGSPSTSKYIQVPLYLSIYLSTMYLDVLECACRASLISDTCN